MKLKTYEFGEVLLEVSKLQLLTFWGLLDLRINIPLHTHLKYSYTKQNAKKKKTTTFGILKGNKAYSYRIFSMTKVKDFISQNNNVIEYKSPNLLKFQFVSFQTVFDTKVSQYFMAECN